MSFPRYPSYKDCGVEWLGEVPEHWEVKPLKHRLRLITEKTERREHPVALENIEGWTGRFIPTETEFQGDGVAFEVGDILFGKLRPYLAKAYLAETPGEAVGDFHVMRPASYVCGRFAQYQILTREFIAIVDGSTFGAKMPRASWDFMSGMKQAIPSFSEQAAIASFLDCETAKIDALVAEQQRLIELLKEKRQAIISHAVTKGLNPEAPMNPSGVEWLGEVPEHWTTKPLKYIATIGNGSTPSRDNPGYWAESGFPWLNSSVVNTPLVTEAEGFVTEQALQECHLPIVAPPAVLVGITGQGRTRGMAAVLGIEATINQHVAYVKPSTANLNVEFLFRVLEMSYLKLRQDSEEAGATKGAITCEQIGNLSIPVPPVGEQAAIVLFLSDRTAKSDTLTAEAQRAIDLLQERRAALISAAVTGQIDVRHLAEGIPA